MDVANFDVFDQAVSHEIEKIFEFAKNADSLSQLKDHIQQQYPGITQGSMTEVLTCIST